MSAEQYKAIIRRWVEEVWNQGNLALADELMPPNYLLHAGNDTMHGPDGFKGLCASHRAAFPDMHITVEDLIAEGDRCVWRFTASGTQDGELPGGMPPTGKSMTIAGIVISRFDGDRWVEDWASWDVLGMLQQLGHLPTPSQAPAMV